MDQEYYRLPHGDVIALAEHTPFPTLSHALTEPNGLIAIGGNLSPERLLSAYRQGIFPWFSLGEPILWWSPDPRMVLYPDELYVNRSLKKVMQQAVFNIKINTAFREVITHCASTPRPNQTGTWLTPEMIEAYCQLHEDGYAMSVESWLDGQLVGGCYGIKIGRMFYGESMFHHVSNASKVAFVHLVNWLKNQHVGMIDCQMKTPLLTQFGGREISRDSFISFVHQLIPYDAS
jgi:leucyl/phenylalanyl-tRNA--protein transferase